MFPLEKFLNLILFRPNILVMAVSEQDKALMHNITDSTLKIAYCSYYKILRIYQNHFPSSGGFLKEDLYSFITGFMLFHFHFLYELTDETVQALITGGVIQHSFEMEEFSMNHEVYAASMNINFLKQKPKVLTVDDLSYGFTLWLLSLMTTLIVFLLELTIFHLGMRGYKLLHQIVCK